MEEKRAYGIFADLLLEEKVYMDRRITFARLCRWLGVSRKVWTRLSGRNLVCPGKRSSGAFVRQMKSASGKNI